MPALIQEVKMRVLLVLYICLVFTGGYVVGKLEQTKPKPRAPETAAAEIKYAEGSRTLPRVVESPPPPPLPEPPGVKTRVRAAVVDLAPNPEPSKLQVDLVEMKDGTERITVKGPSVAGGQDFPIGPPRPLPPVHKWTLGGGVGFKNYTVVGLRAFGPVEIGGLIQRDRKDSRAWDAQIFALIHF